PALEWAERPDRTALVDPLVADATARVEALQSRHIIRRIVPREARFLPVPVVIALALMLAPALPLPSGRLPDFTPGSQEDEKEQRTGSGLLEERSRPEARERLRPPAFEEREFQARSGASTARAWRRSRAVRRTRPWRRCRRRSTRCARRKRRSAPARGCAPAATTSVAPARAIVAAALRAAARARTLAKAKGCCRARARARRRRARRAGG